MIWIIGALAVFVVVSVLVIVGAVIIAAKNDSRDETEYLRDRNGDK